MAVIKFLPKKDASLYSFNPLQNTGMDEILSLIISNGKLTDYNTGISRILLEFDNNEINSIYSPITSSKDISLKLFLANAVELPSEYTLEVRNINDTWKNGYGKFHNIPITNDGVSWKTLNSISDWTIRSGSDYDNYSPNNYSSSYWKNDISSSVLLGIYDEKDLNISVKDLYSQQISQSLSGGYLIKFNIQHEQDVTINSELSFYSKDTHTIYKPLLEVKFDDSVYTTSGNLITSSNFIISLSNNKSVLSTSTTERINILSRDAFPKRTFSTGSLYTNKKYLPSTTYYAIKDVKTGQYVVDFDDNYTKVSRDIDGNFFNLYLKNFEQNRYYMIDLKIVMGSYTFYHNDTYIFKTVK